MFENQKQSQFSQSEKLIFNLCYYSSEGPVGGIFAQLQLQPQTLVGLLSGFAGLH